MTKCVIARGGARGGSGTISVSLFVLSRFAAHQRDRQTERQADTTTKNTGSTDRQADKQNRQIERQADKRTETDR